MHPELFTLPVVGITIKTYGFCLTVGFLSAVWFAMRRAQRVKADPDVLLDLCFLSLLFGVGGARVFYVIHYWQTQFAPVPNKLLAIIDIRQGGLEFLGGLLGAMGAVFLYLYVKKRSIRLYLDIMAPGAMWGLAFGRLGCFFNGCCFGGLCLTAADQPQFPWAVEFPFGSPAQVREWEDRVVTVPAELINTKGMLPYLLPPSALMMSVEKREEPRQKVRELERALRRVESADGSNGLAAQGEKIQEQLKKAKSASAKFEKKHRLNDVKRAQAFPSRENPERITSVSELESLAGQSRSQPIHPAQLYAAIHALLLSLFLSAIFYQRRRHGVVIGLLIVLYPIARVLLEIIRTDNPQDTAGLTVSQFVSVSMFLFGVTYLLVLYRKLPERSPALEMETAVATSA